MKHVERFTVALSFLFTSEAVRPAPISTPYTFQQGVANTLTDQDLALLTQWQPEGLQGQWPPPFLGYQQAVSAWPWPQPQTVAVALAQQPTSPPQSRLVIPHLRFLEQRNREDPHPSAVIPNPPIATPHFGCPGEPSCAAAKLRQGVEFCKANPDALHCKSQSKCAGPCTNGKCVDGRCQCNEGFKGASCDQGAAADAGRMVPMSSTPQPTMMVPKPTTEAPATTTVAAASLGGAAPGPAPGAGAYGAGAYGMYGANGFNCMSPLTSFHALAAQRQPLLMILANNLAQCNALGCSDCAVVLSSIFGGFAVGPGPGPMPGPGPAPGPAPSPFGAPGAPGAGNPLCGVLAMQRTGLVNQIAALSTQMTQLDLVMKANACMVFGTTPVPPTTPAMAGAPGPGPGPGPGPAPAR
eukprot:gnl/MRDRNA2_/MRDRNA2_71722_c0_seq1.p1 gnl/MRDRNA2_/MRDRNA2_71722_c0~~gnl/MRDRNA2_/MRDRNA2_71722_c0_seq1.p1  ORF type:complete len:410 (-),score=71.71 gnl/MRDRNA2_/MRDRNA2_71722_c0_seq1:47-1276(-)